MKGESELFINEIDLIKNINTITENNLVLLKKITKPIDGKLEMLENLKLEKKRIPV